MERRVEAFVVKQTAVLMVATALVLGGCGESGGQSEGQDPSAQATVDARTEERLRKLEEEAREAREEARRERAKARARRERERAAAETAPASAAAPAASGGGGGIVVPDVVGLDHQAAQDAMQGEGLWLLDERDCSGQGRALLWDRNWEVVSTDPPAGTAVSEDTVVTLCSVKQGER